MRRWLAHRELQDKDAKLTPEDHASVLRARQALGSLLAANNGGGPEPTAIGQLDEVLAGTSFELRCDAGGPACFEPTSPDVRAPLGKLLAIVVAARNAGTWPRLKACADPECRTAFFDASSKAKWCTKRCGDRMRARTHRRSRPRR